MNDKLEEARRAIDSMFEDMSVDKDTAKERLEDLIEHCQMLRDSL